MPHVIHVPWTNPTQHSKLHLDWFGVFAHLMAERPYNFTVCIKTQLTHNLKIVNGAVDAIKEINRYTALFKA